MSESRPSNLNQGVASTDRNRRIAPPVLQLNEGAVSEYGLEAIEGSIIVLYGEEDAAPVETFDEALESDDSAVFHDQMADEMAAALDESSEESEGVSVSAELTYHGKTVLDDISLTDSESFSLSMADFKGGKLDEMEFKVDETGESSVEYRIITVPPTLDEGEKDARNTISKDTDDSEIHVSTEAADLCGTALLVAAGVAGGLAAGSIVTRPNEGLTEGIEEPVDEGASVDELIEAQS